MHKRKTMAELTADIPSSLRSALDKEVSRTKATRSSVITAALADYLGTPVHTLFQISTSGALVAGVHSGVVRVQAVLEHGDFGLGTFADLDGEMVVVDGRVYRVPGTGPVSEAPLDAPVPFAIVTRFSPDVDATTNAIASFRDLEVRCDSRRVSGNIFYAFRLDGRFSHVRARAVNKATEGARLVDAAKAQSEFHFTDVVGTLVGIWSPGFSSAFSVPGYHFHFLSEDRKRGGHLLDCAAETLRLRMEALTDFHLALPETEAFLKADLNRNTAGELAYAEKAH
jgi:acetolactate decarboxylase